mmetsp:Transcript_55375/g.103916  ORF Transcript_55375/g.103916 Transcript_55375/m.103916 type:complete len:370 (-) Transcript_55375:147-1256(-)
MVHAMLLANLPCDEADSVIAVMTNAGEQVVLDLGGEPKGHVVPEVGVGSKVHALGNLHLRPGIIRVGVRVQDDVSNLGAGDEDCSSREVHAQVAKRGRTEEVVEKAPRRNLEDDPTEAVVHLVPTNISSDEDVNDHALQTKLEDGTDEDPRDGKGLQPSWEDVGQPNVLHIHVLLLVAVLVRAHMVADHVLIVPVQGRSDEKESTEEAQAVDPLLLADLPMAALMRKAGPDRGNQASSSQAGQRRAHHEEQPHHDTPQGPQREENMRAHSRAAATSREGLANTFLDLLVERIDGRGGCAIGFEDLAVLVVPWVVRLEEGGAVATAACQNCHAATRVLVDELMQVVAVAVDVPKVRVVDSCRADLRHLRR